MSARSITALLALLALQPACGGSSASSDGDPQGGGGAVSSGGKGGSVGSGGKSSGGSSSGGAGSGGAATGGSNTGGSSAGSGGSVDVGQCSTPYAGPLGGPRAEGPPALLTSCALISDEEILARYDDFSAKVPTELYWEPPGLGAVWEEPCSDSLQTTVERSAAGGYGVLEGQFTTNWFYEAAYCDGMQRRLYRNLRCDYFDGETLSGGTPSELAFLASLLWWQDNNNITGNAVLGYAISIGNATDWVEVCTIQTVYGDFGLCDEITLESTTHSVMIGGAVMLGEPTLVRTLEGTCH